MKASIGVESALSFIKSQSRPPIRRPSGPGHPRRAVMISRQAGAGSHVVAEALVARLSALAPEGSPPWTVFDRNLVEKVLEDHDLPNELARFMPEDRVLEISDTLDGLFGLRPSSWSLVRKTADTILHLAEFGNVVVIGRGANVITSKLDYALHIRLVGSLDRRIEHVREYKHLGRGAAIEYVQDEDVGRKRYVKKYYGQDIDDPLLYDMVINTDRVPYEEASRIIAEAVYPRHGQS
jgi:hypothetical protein